jgi:hypothetical protein
MSAPDWRWRSSLTAPRKQWHTATQGYRRLVAEYGYTGSYDPSAAT